MRKSGVVAAAAVAIGLLATPPASAETVSGWIGPSTANSVAYLHQSSITTTPYLFASAAVWTPFGQPIAVNAVGVNARLFKSGILCSATDYFYNGYTTVNYAVSTGDPDCGPGSYNSHGLVRLFNGTGYNTVVTFPTNPVNIGAATRSAVPDVEVPAGTTADGRTTGTAEGIETESELPDLVAAFASNGEQGFVLKTDLASPELAHSDVEALPTSTLDDGTVVRTTGSRTVPVYADNGVDVIGEFAIQ
ncbi:hypothetical protein CH299_28820 [Rhodococcus sp. 14-2686-1-2]|nr:hypothetical protein CH299_28820 [Rhodococcus sp. 14-2686-1-2]